MLRAPDERAEPVAALLEVAELVERGAGRREQDGVAGRGGARRPACERGSSAVVATSRTPTATTSARSIASAAAPIRYAARDRGPSRPRGERREVAALVGAAEDDRGRRVERRQRPQRRRRRSWPSSRSSRLTPPSSPTCSSRCGERPERPTSACSTPARRRAERAARSAAAQSDVLEVVGAAQRASAERRAQVLGASARAHAHAAPSPGTVVGSAATHGSSSFRTATSAGLLALEHAQLGSGVRLQRAVPVEVVGRHVEQARRRRSAASSTSSSWKLESSQTTMLPARDARRRGPTARTPMLPATTRRGRRRRRASRRSAR